MTSITFQDGKVVVRDGNVGIGQDCCCGGDQPVACNGGGPGGGTLDPPNCGYDNCCYDGFCVEAEYFQADVGDCICYTAAQGNPPEGSASYASYSECCAENFCPDPPP